MTDDRSTHSVVAVAAEGEAHERGAAVASDGERAANSGTKPGGTGSPSVSPAVARAGLADDSRLSVDTVTTPAALFERLDGGRVDAVVCAPDGAEWDAVELLEALTERREERGVEAHVPVVLVTGSDVDEYVDAGVLSRVADVVRPDDRGALVEAVERAVDARRTRESDRNAAERYRSLVDGSPVPVGVLDSDGRFHEANEPLAALLEVDAPSELVGREVTSFVADEARATSAERLERVLTAREPAAAVHRTLVAATGERKYVLSAVHPVAVDGGPGAQVVLNDITDHKRLQAALREQRDRFSTLFENLSEPVVETRFEGETPVVQAVNAAFAETFGVDSEAVVGDRLDEIIVPADDRADAAALNRRGRAGERVEVEVTRETPEGPREFLLRLAPYESDGERGGYAIYVDITDRREWERQLQRQNERLEEVAAVVSHDLRNPLNVAAGVVDVLARGADGEEAEHFERVQRAHERMEAIIGDMLTLARQGQSVSDQEPVSLARTAADAWETTDTAGATLEVATDATVCADETRLRQALENLFRNAVEHGGPDVTVSVGDMPDCPLEDGGDGAERRRGGFYVADDGPGIPEGDRDAVFESGHTTADEGTGFGLAIVQSIVEAHGWDVAVTESADGGARFEVTGVEHVD